MRNLIVLMFLISCVGCAQNKWVKPNPGFDVTIDSEKKSRIIDLSIEAVWYSGYSDWLTKIPAGISGFKMVAKNNKKNIVKIVWEKSSISYLNGSYTIFLAGQKYIDAGKAPTPSLIVANGSINHEIYSSIQPRLESYGWSMDRIKANEVVIILWVESGNEEDYYTVKVKEKETTVTK